MSRDATAESDLFLEDEQTTRNPHRTQEFLEICVETLEELLINRSCSSWFVSLGAEHTLLSDLEKCLLRGIEIVQWDNEELSPLAHALTVLLQTGANWHCDALLDYQRTPCHIICQSPGDHHELLDLWIKSSQGRIIDTQDIYNRTALLYAVRNANINCLKCLIASGADVNMASDRYDDIASDVPAQQWSPIKEAIQRMGYGYEHTSVNVYADIFDVLLDNGVEVNTPPLKFDTSPIIAAVSLQNVYCVKTLIEKGVSLDAIDYYGRYVRSVIAEMGNIELLKCMFNHGVDKDSADRTGLSVLWCVVGSGNVEAVRYLLHQGVAIPTYSPDVRESQCDQCQENTLLIDDDKWQVHETHHPCMRAINHNMLEIVKLLDQHRSCDSFSVLRHAVLYGNADMTSYLLNRHTYPLNMHYIKESTEHRYKLQYTLLTEINSTLHIDANLHNIIKLLLDHGADPAAPMCPTSNSAIMTAIHYRKLDVIAQYIRSGVNINFRSSSDSHRDVLPFEASVLRGYHNAAKMFLLSGCSCGVFSLDNNHMFKNNLKLEVEKLMKEWKVQKNNVTPLQQQCRGVILNQLSPRADIKIDKLPLPDLIIKFLNFCELDDIVDRYREEMGHL